MSVNARVQKHRDSLQQSGLRLVQIQVPDTRHSNFVEEYRRQCRLVAEANWAE